ncbi:ARM repeat superfamily protein [Wolffia australiana]
MWGRRERQLDAHKFTHWLSFSPSSATGMIGGEEISQLVYRLDSLISLSSSIKPFAGKWQSIRTLLTDLVADFSTSSLSLDNPAFRELLSSMTISVDEAETLANACEAFDGGKLLMKSNLDLLLSKFDLQRKTLTELLGREANAHSAIVLSKPPSGAKKDDMALYVKDLHQRMKLSDQELATRALSSLNEVLAEDDKYARIAAVDLPEVAGTLILLLSSEEEEVQHLAAEAVSLVASHPVYRPLLVLSGAVNALINVLERGSLLGKRPACTGLKKLTENSDNAWAFSAHGGVTAVLRICAEEDSGGEILTTAAAGGVLKNLLPVKEIRRFMVEQGAVGIFLKLARSEEEPTLVLGLELLQAMASQDLAARKKIAEEHGVVEFLVQLLGSTSTKSVSAALGTIEALCLSPGSLLRAGFLHSLLLLLRQSEMLVLEPAVAATARLAAISEEASREMGRTGFMSELMRLLRSKSVEGRALAAAALARIMGLKRNQRRFLEEEEDGVGELFSLLGPDEKSAVKKAVLAALLAVSWSSVGRKRIAQSGQIQRLEKLAEMEMGDAKRILRRASSGRLWSRLADVWSF